MKKLRLILLLIMFKTGMVFSQAFTVDDLVTLSSLPAKNIDPFMNKKGYISQSSYLSFDMPATSFIENKPDTSKNILIYRSIDLYKKDDSRFFVLHTSSKDEYIEGKRQLRNAGFFYDSTINLDLDTSILFQKRNTSILTMTGTEDNSPVYSFVLKKKEFPEPAFIQHAEDLLNFTSHEYLVTYFGVNNVKKDLYYFTDRELKKCSVLFDNTNHEAVFVWGDENNLCNLSYIIISNINPVLSAKDFNGFIGDNVWRLKNGIYPGMSLKELLKLNDNDFEIYGNKSEFAFFVKREKSGKIDFNKIAVTLSCISCNNDRIFKTTAVKAMDVADQNLPMYVNDIIIFPPVITTTGKGF